MTDHWWECDCEDCNPGVKAPPPLVYRVRFDALPVRQQRRAQRAEREALAEQSEAAE